MNKKSQIDKRINQRAYAWILFGVIFITSIVFSKIINVTYYRFDSDWYWTFGDPVFENGFHLLRFPKMYRGYFYVILLGILKRIFPGFWGWILLSAVSAAVCFAFSLPYVIHSRLTNSKKDAVRGYLSYLVFMMVWKHFMQYPHSDFMAAFFFITGAALVKSYRNQSKVLLQFVTGFCAGVFLYAAYNTRVVYLYGTLVLLIFFFVSNLKNLQRLFIGLLVLVVGMAFLAFPQSMINKQNDGSYSPFVNTMTETDLNLEVLQLYWGLTIDRFEGYVGEVDLFENSQVYYENPVGFAICERDGLSRENFTVREFFRELLKHPLDFLGIYARHFISMMTPGFRIYPYNTNLFEDKSFLVVTSILIWIIAGYGLTNQIKTHGFSVDGILIFAICLPSLMEIVGAPEIRFFMPIYLLGYHYVFEAIDYNELRKDFSVNWLQTSFCMIVIFCLWISVFSDMMASNQKIPLLINDREPVVLSENNEH